MIEGLLFSVLNCYDICLLANAHLQVGLSLVEKLMSGRGEVEWGLLGLNTAKMKRSFSIHSTHTLAKLVHPQIITARRESREGRR